MKKIIIFCLTAILCFGIYLFGNFSLNAHAENAILQKLKPNLDSRWELAYFNSKQNTWIAEYGLKGEDVVNFKWTKLITVNGTSGMPQNLTPKIYTLNFKALLNKQAGQMSSSLFFKDLGLSQNEEWFIWSIYGRNETEMCRVFIKNGVLYHMHYAIKNPKFSESEFNYALNVLRNIQVN